RSSDLVAADVHTVAVAGGITGDGAVAGVAQVTADADTGTVSTVTVHGGVGQGAVTADVHTGAIAGGTAADDTVSDVAADVHTVTVAGSVTRDGAVAAVALVTADADAGTVSTVTAHGGVVQGAVTADVHAGTIAGGTAA